ncbi:Hypothetical_protein [Hexamita inflata]|uniref:Hypothetical_protein n=1 Tax=Hexamita inflata TaxID=28002 RepID=A0AA86RCK7_9EUKA|nr:Hypothetical protein HINF_LOCUS59788 [Hexamita inflata]
MDGSGCGKQSPRVSEKLVPSRLRETGIIFHCFRLLRPLDFWKESQTSRRHWERAGQQESTMINEYISTTGLLEVRNSLVFSLDFIVKALLGLICFHVHALTSTSQISAIILRTACTSCNCFVFEFSQQHWLKLARLQRSSARSTPYFPFPFSLVQAVQQSLSAGVGRLHLQEVV